MQLETETIVNGVQEVDLAVVKSYAADLRQLLEESEFSERKAFLRSFVKRIEINGTNAKITYKLPEKTGGKYELKAEVLPIVTSSGPDRTFANRVESFFELSIVAAPSYPEGRGYEPK